MAFFSEEFIRRVRDANDIIQVIESRGVALRRAGTNLIGLCPFHREKTPSFNVRPAEQYFRCFGCDAKGDVVTFLMKHDRLDFPGAVTELARAAGIPLEQQAPGEAARMSRATKQRDGLLWVNRTAGEWFEECLWSPRGRAALAYLTDRGFTEATIRNWRLGWSPDEWDGLIKRLTQGATAAEQRRQVMEYAREAGLVRRKDEGEVRYYDAFRGRVMFPIMDAQRRIVGFGGRVLRETEHTGGKYINSSEGKLFEKRKILFGLPFASRAIGEKAEAVVVEGYTDTIMCHQYGIEQVVATLGTALTEDHIRVLRRYVGPGGKVVAFFDNDAAGLRATDRAIRLFMKEDVALTVATGLAMKDACAFLPQFGVDAFREQLSHADDSFGYLLKHTVGAARNRDVGARAAAVAAAVEIVNLCPDPIKRAYMRKALAAEAEVPESTLPEPPEPPEGTAGAGGGKRISVRRAPVAAGGKTAAAGRVATAPVSSEQTTAAVAAAMAGTEAERRRRYARILAHMWANAHWAERIAHEFPPDEMLDAASAEVGAALRDHWAKGVTPVLNDLLRQCVEPGAAELLIELATGPEQSALTPSEAELAELMRWVERERLALRVRELQDAMKAARQRGDAASENELLLEFVALQRRVKP